MRHKRDDLFKLLADVSMELNQEQKNYNTSMTSPSDDFKLSNKINSEAINNKPVTHKENRPNTL